MASINQSKHTWLSIVYLLLLIAGIVSVFAGTARYETQENLGLLYIGLGAAALIVTIAAFPIALAVLHAERADEMREVRRLLAAIHERQLVSEAAKRINARRHDCEMLRRAIEEDITAHDLDSAMLLTIDLAQSFGQKHESEEIRERIVAARATQYQQRIGEAIDRFEQLVNEQLWDSAQAEAAKLKRLFPESPLVADLPGRVDQAQAQHKNELERQFLEAAQRDDVELAARLLHDLDKYLPENEAAPFIEVARGVFRKKKENLGVQFKMAVQDKDWIMAAQVGEHIIREFPNTRMAGEIREMIDPLRERAANQSAASRQM